MEITLEIANIRILLGTLSKSFLIMLVRQGMDRMVRIKDLIFRLITQDLLKVVVS